MQKWLILCWIIVCCITHPVYATRTSVLAFGANGHDSLDDTEAIQQAINLFDTIFIPAGVYRIVTLHIGDNKVLTTAGYKTKLQQLPNHSGKQIIRIEGSNVWLGAMSYEGNIATDSSEFNYAVFIVPPLNKNTRNIVVKGVNARHLRGDAVSIGNSGTTIAENVTVENVTVYNCYRNGISVVGGRNITIRYVDVQHSGMLGIDIEAEGGQETILEDITIDAVKAGNICISGRESRVRNVRCSNLQLDGNRQLSTPRYKPMQNAGIIIYNAENITFNNVSITNMPGFAIFAGDIYEHYELLSQNVVFNKLNISNSALTDKIYHSYICVMGLRSLQLNGLNARLKPDQILLLGKSETIENSQMVRINKGNISSGKLLAKNCSLTAELVSIRQSEQLFECMNRIVLTKCAIVGKLPPMTGNAQQRPCQKGSVNAMIEISTCTFNNKPFSIAKTGKHDWLKQ